MALRVNLQYMIKPMHISYYLVYKKVKIELHPLTLMLHTENFYNTCRSLFAQNV